MFRLFLFEAEYRASHPIVIILPGRIFMSWCTANAVSTQYFTVPVPLDSKVSTKSLVLLRYSSMRELFLSSSSSGSLTRIVRKSTPVRISGRARLNRKNKFSRMVWNAWASFSLNLCEVSLTSKKWFSVVVIALP